MIGLYLIKFGDLYFVWFCHSWINFQETFPLYIKEPKQCSVSSSYRNFSLLFCEKHFTFTWFINKSKLLTVLLYLLKIGWFISRVKYEHYVIGETCAKTVQEPRTKSLYLCLSKQFLHHLIDYIKEEQRSGTAVFNHQPDYEEFYF